MAFTVTTPTPTPTSFQTYLHHILHLIKLSYTEQELCLVRPNTLTLYKIP